MSHRLFLRFAAVTAFALFAQATVLHAQRVRNTVISENLESGQISGKVTDTTGAVSGAEVVLSYKGRTIGSATTGKDGNYSFKALSAGRYDVVWSKDGYRKRIVYEIPVVENYLTHNDLDLARTNTWYNARKTNVQYYEDRTNAKIEKMQ